MATALKKLPILLTAQRPAWAPGCLLIWLLLLAFASGCTTTDAPNHSAAKTNADIFFSMMRNHLGYRYPGWVDPDGTPENLLGDEPLEIEFTIGSYDEIHIPLRVGDDRSRTWILRRTDSGIELRHDHRHADGTPEALTGYGGFSTDDGTPLRQRFPADNATANLIPEAATNVWTLELRSDSYELVYDLTRHGRPRFRAVFDLSEPLRD